MWTDTTRAYHARAELALPSDLTDAEWTVLEPFFRRPRWWAALANGRCVAFAEEPARSPPGGLSEGDLGDRAHAQVWRPLARLPDRFWPLDHGLQSLEQVEQARHLDAVSLRPSPKRVGSPRPPRSTAATSRRTGVPAAQKGARAQAIGISRGGRTTKIHALVDVLGRPLRLALTPGNTSNIKGADLLVGETAGMKRLIADRGYNANRLAASQLTS